MKPSILVIYNPAAGRGRAQAKWAIAEKAMRAAGIEFDTVATRAPLGAMMLAEQAAQKYSTVIAVGGDGTVHEVVNGLLRASGENETTAMGIVPFGTGNDFAKMIPPGAPVGGAALDWRTAVQKIARGETRLFDAGRMSVDHMQPERGNGPHYFMNSMGVGFGAKGAQNFSAIPRFLPGPTAYLAAAIRTMMHYPVLRVCIQLDDLPPFQQATTITSIMNGRCFGSRFWVCPVARADDGLFDVMVSKKISRITILRLISKIMKGTHVNEPCLQMYRARRVEISSREPMVVEADGEIPYLEAHRLHVEILHRKIRVIV